MSAWTYRRLTARPPKRLFRLVLESHDGRAPGADSEEKHEPVSDIDTVVVDSLKALDPEWPIREADTAGRFKATSYCGSGCDDGVRALAPLPPCSVGVGGGGRAASGGTSRRSTRAGRNADAG